MNLFKDAIIEEEGKTVNEAATTSGGLFADAVIEEKPDYSLTHQALRDVISSTESPDYNVIYGGQKFEKYDKHPGVYVDIKSGPNKGKKSSAAGSVCIPGDSEQQKVGQVQPRGW